MGEKEEGKLKIRERSVGKMEFGRRRFVRGSSGGVPNRVCVTPEPTTYYGEYSRRSLVSTIVSTSSSSGSIQKGLFVGLLVLLVRVG